MTDAESVLRESPVVPWTKELEVRSRCDTACMLDDSLLGQM